jgi:aminopeptidase-like protein
MANDDNAGVAILVRLFQELRARETEYSYRLVLGPEHLGTVFYLASLPPQDRARLACGAFCEMPGTPGPVVVASSFLGGQAIDLAFANAARHRAREHRLVPWRQGAGNDETVWEAPGYEIPFVEVSRSRSLWEPFPEYHTSLDTAELMDEALLDEMLDVFRAALRALDENVVAHRQFEGLPALSSPRYRLYRERPDPAVAKELPEDAEKWGYLADSLLRLFDGRTTVLEIAERFELPFDEVRAYVQQFADKGLVRLERVHV